MGHLIVRGGGVADLATCLLAELKVEGFKSPFHTGILIKNGLTVAHSNLPSSIA
jgi:hypothetical protein